MGGRAGKGRFRGWTDSRNREVARRLAAQARDLRGLGDGRRPAKIDAPHTRANQPCFYDNGGNPNLVVPSVLEGRVGTAAAARDWPEFRVWSTLETGCERIDRVSYRHRHGHVVERWLLETRAQFDALRAWRRRRRTRLRDEVARGARGERVGARHTTHREFDRQPIRSTQLEPGVTIECRSYRAFEREVERRGKQIPDGDIR